LVDMSSVYLNEIRIFISSIKIPLLWFIILIYNLLVETM